MCGIFFSLCLGSFREASNETITALQARGPDSLRSHKVTVKVNGQDERVNANEKEYKLTLLSTVLALRGASIHDQPLVDEYTGSSLCWNGEAWQFGGQSIAGNDAQFLFDLLLKASTPSLLGSADAVVNVLTNIAGPFAFVFYDNLSKRVYFGRDRLGRRSLLISQTSNGEIYLSSIGSRSHGSSWTEVQSRSLYTIDLTTLNPRPQALPWVLSLPTINKVTNSLLRVPRTPSASTVDELYSQLIRSLTLRVTDIPVLGHSERHKGSAKVAVLFSGGLDCTLLASLIHLLIPKVEEIDLLNVAFENPRSIVSKSPTSISPYESCPDRITGRRSHAELARTCPGRLWRFVAIDVPFRESSTHRSTIIDLMAPHNTEMDLSITMALYFAARGQGGIWVDEKSQPNPSIYTTPARVLLSGLGADELFAGYTRHAAAFARRGFPGLIEELDLDFSRIGHRNLGRDDRAISHWGREVRYPYLDEEFVRWSLELPVWEKCGFRQRREADAHAHRVEDSPFESIKMPKFDEAMTTSSERAVGRKEGSMEPTMSIKARKSGTRSPNEATDETNPSRATSVYTVTALEPAKLLLRMLAWRLGIFGAANERKRAIQFGARTAKMLPKQAGQSRVRGTDIVE